MGPKICPFESAEAKVTAVDLREVPQQVENAH
jgi:hypothetical protein